MAGELEQKMIFKIRLEAIISFQVRLQFLCEPLLAIKNQKFLTYLFSGGKDAINPALTGVKWVSDKDSKISVHVNFNQKGIVSSKLKCMF